jgi:hypothetical protein
MATYYRAYSDAADARAEVSNATYATARSSTAATTNTNTTSVPGQAFSTPNYLIGQAFLQFDTSAWPAGGDDVILQLSVTGAAAGGDTLEVRDVNAISNKIAAASLGSFTLFASTAMPTTTGKVPISIAPSSIARSATLFLLLSSANERNNVAPTGAERATVNMADQNGRSLDPFLQMRLGPVWQYIGKSAAVVETTTATHTLTEPANVQQGDLLVACIASRIASTTSITLPAEWALVSEQKTSSTLTTSSAVASGMMAYCIRGASPPSYAFTHPTNPSVALGNVVAYRNVDAVVPKDTQTSFTTAVNTTSVSGAGLTTADIEELIVAMFAGGQEATISVFLATDPAETSNIANQTADPLLDVWLERGESTTTTGADTSLAIYDTVKASAGVTGNLTCTASVAASHVVVAGAFNLSRPRRQTVLNNSFAVMRAANW